MAKTTAERQAAWRARRQDAGAERLEVLISARTKRRLEALSRKWGMSQRQTLERTIDQAAPATEVVAPIAEPQEANTATVLLWLRIENNNKFVRGKKRTIENIECFHLEQYGAIRRRQGEYELKVPYSSDEDLDETINDLLAEIADEADLKYCFSESEAQLEGSERYWP